MVVLVLMVVLLMVVLLMVVALMVNIVVVVPMVMPMVHYSDRNTNCATVRVPGADKEFTASVNINRSFYLQYAIGLYCEVAVITAENK